MTSWGMPGKTGSIISGCRTGTVTPVGQVVGCRSLLMLAAGKPPATEHVSVPQSKALCRIKSLPVTHVLVDTWMLTVRLVYEFSDVPDDLKWATNAHMTPFTLTFKA